MGEGRGRRGGLFMHVDSMSMDKIGEEIKRFIKHGMVCIEGMER